MTVLDGAERAVHNPYQNACESHGTESHGSKEAGAVSPYICGGSREKTMACESVRNAGQWALQDLNL